MESSKSLDDLKQQFVLPSPLQTFQWDEIGLTMHVKRDDLIHPVISGNKWRKLAEHLKYYFTQHFDGIASMGGAHSNHMHALSFACFLLDIPNLCFIYGHGDWLKSPTITDCQKWNSTCEPISRIRAQDFRQTTDDFIEIENRKYYWIPEGGGGALGIQGIKQMLDEYPKDFDRSDQLILCGCGTGTSIEGILEGTTKINVAGLRIVKSGVYRFEKHPRFIWLNHRDEHKFAALDDELSEFMSSFQSRFGIPLDRVYTGPLLLAFSKAQNLHAYKKIFFLHSGGLQGNRVPI
ncbi:MAG: hypothetical protein IPM34_05910 [Saprospiraceae bacterium]|nr:hypothetical protein [Saprospiraceae bacterium]